MPNSEGNEQSSLHNRYDRLVGVRTSMAEGRGKNPRNIEMPHGKVSLPENVRGARKALEVLVAARISAQGEGNASQGPEANLQGPEAKFTTRRRNPPDHR